MNSQTPEGGPAFPTTFIEVEYGSSYGGMTLRDYFAGQALMGFIAASGNRAVLPKPDARRCYEMADAMISARESDAP